MSQVDEFHYCAGLAGALPFSVADCPYCTEADYPPSLVDRLAEVERKLAAIREECEAWALFEHPTSGERIKWVEQGAVLDILDGGENQ